MTKHVIIFFTAVIFFLPVTAYPDVVSLKEGTVLVGKIISEDKDAVAFTNAYGSFRIKRIYIISIYRTEDWTEDIEFLKKQGAALNKEGIEKHLEAGQKKKDELTGAVTGKEKADGTRKSGIISLSGSFSRVVDGPREKLPYGFSGNIAFDQCLSGSRNTLIPGLRLDAGYLLFSHASYKISGYQAGLGFIWTVSPFQDKKGHFVLAATPGISFLSIENSDAGSSAKSNTFAASAITGYRFHLWKFLLFVHARYIYIYDKSVPMHTIGGEIGFGYNLW